MLALEPREGGALLRIATPLAAELRPGDSIAVNGVCLTAVDVGGAEFTAEAVAETLRRSALGALRAGARVNLELALRAEDRLGGHVVQGHVDGTATVTSVRSEGSSRVLELEPAPGLARYIVHKGSIALDGVSLTVSELAGPRFSVALIPETLARTNLGMIGEGDAVNVEVDILAKHVERLLAPSA